MAASVDLKVNRSLLDPDFDGYKLSLDKLSTYRNDLEQGVDEVKLSDDQYSYQHVKAFGIHNHLIPDPWDCDTVYFIDSSWRVFAQNVILETSLQPPVEVFSIPDHANKRLQPFRHNLTMSFPNAEWAILADGSGQLYVIKTGNRKEQGKWTVSYSETCLGEGKPFTILHSTMESDNETHQLDCLLLHVDPLDDVPVEGDSNQSLFVTVLEWVTFVTAVANASWSRERTRRLTGVRSPDYASIEIGGRAVIVSAERQFKMVYDSAKPVEEPKEEAATAEPPPAFTWQQTNKEISVQFTLPNSVSKADIAFQLTPGQVELGIKNGDQLLWGELQYDVDVEGSTWTLDGNRLELTLSKKEPRGWSLVVCGDTRGRMVIDPNEVKLIHERLAHLTSESLNPDPEEGQKPAYNAQQLEDCDMYPDDASTMLRIDGETHKPTHIVHLGSNQWLFNTTLVAGKSPAICLRHDVDGLLWQPTMDSTCPWEHTATFNAFGYVQASKINKKFEGCAANFSYAFVADCSRHVYIYRQPAGILSPLRNRKTGRNVTAIAKQQVVSLDTTDDIHGVVATPERLFILTGKRLFVVRVKLDD